MKKINLLFTLFAFIAFSGCEKDESGYGNYVIGVTNTTATSYSLGIYIDGEFEGTLVARANESGFADCDNLDPTLENVYIVTYVPAGSHKVELKDSGTERVMSSGNFNMTADGCTSQQATL